jgi:hypothetical protein
MGGVNEDLVSTITSMGFERSWAVYALQVHGNSVQIFRILFLIQLFFLFSKYLGNIFHPCYVAVDKHKQTTPKPLPVSSLKI